MTIPSIAWCHPRPRPDCFVGSFPRGFEVRLVRLIQTELGNPCEDILSLFSGLSEFGVSVDLNASTTPDHVADCHDLGFLADESFDLAVADPPYSAEESEVLYSMPPPRWGVWTAEAVRVLRTGGHLVVYLDKQSGAPGRHATRLSNCSLDTDLAHAPSRSSLQKIVSRRAGAVQGHTLSGDSTRSSFGRDGMPMPTAGEFEGLLRRGMARCPDCMLIGKQGLAVEFPADRASIRSSRGQFLCRYHLRLESHDDADDLARTVLEFALMGASDQVIGEISGYRPGAVRKNQAYRRGRRQCKAALALAVLASRSNDVSAAQVARDVGVPKTTVLRILSNGLTPQTRAGVRELRELPRDELETVLRFVVPRSLTAVLDLLDEAQS